MLTKENELISVVIPAYNAEKYIEATIRSVLAQTYRNFEIIVIDDASTDKTVEIVRKMAENEPRIQLYPNETNLGVALSRNRGFSLAKGQWVALLDSDDVWRAEKLERQLALAKKSGADIIYCSYALVEEKSGERVKDYLLPAETCYEDTLKVSIITCSTALISAEIAQNYRFTSEFYHEDYVFWLELLKKGYRAVGCPEVLADYTLRADSRSFNKLKSARERWVVYRKSQKMSLFQTIKAFAAYAVYGVRKYKR